MRVEPASGYATVLKVQISEGSTMTDHAAPARENEQRCINCGRWRNQHVFTCGIPWCWNNTSSTTFEAAAPASAEAIKVAETYPIEDFWQTQITCRRGSEVYATAAGMTEQQSRDRAMRIVAAEAEIQELKQQLARLSQVNGKLVEALSEAKEFIENLQLDEPEWHSALDSCVIALAEAQKENK